MTETAPPKAVLAILTRPAPNTGERLLIRSDRSAACTLVYHLTEDSTERRLIINELPFGLVQNSAVVEASGGVSNVLGFTWFGDSQIRDTITFLRQVITRGPFQLELETSVGTQSAAIVKSKGLLLHISASGDELMLLGDTGDRIVVPLRSLVRVRVIKSTEDAANALLPTAIFGKTLLVNTDAQLRFQRDDTIRLRLELERNTMQYAVRHNVRLTNPQASSFSWQSDVVVTGDVGITFFGDVLIVERKRDTRRVQIVPEQDIQQSKREAMPESMAPRAAAMSPRRKSAHRGENVENTDLAGATDLEMERVIKEEDPSRPLVASPATSSRFVSLRADKVPCRLIFRHTPGTCGYSDNDQCPTERLLDWVPSALNGGKFLFSGETQVLTHTGNAIQEAGIWFDAWKTPVRHVLSLGPTQRVTAKRVQMGTRNYEKKAVRVDSFRIEYLNQTPVAVLVHLIERVQEASRTPEVQGAFERQYSAGLDPAGEASLLEIRDADRAGWLRSKQVLAFGPYVDEYVDVAEAKTQPMHRSLMLQVPAAAENDLARPGKLVLFFQITYTQSF